MSTSGKIGSSGAGEMQRNKRLKGKKAARGSVKENTLLTSMRQVLAIAGLSGVACTNTAGKVLKIGCPQPAETALP